MQPPDLAPLYYLDNFEALYTSARDQYQDLLLSTELDFFSAFESLSRQARCLYVRLVSRVGPLFREELLNYPELGELQPLLQELEAAGLLAEETEPPLQLLLRLCRKAELESIFAAALEGLSLRRKADIVAFLEAAEPDAEVSVQCWTNWYAHRLVYPLHMETVALLQLLFFGNRHQSLTDFVLSDLGVNRYHNYPLDWDFRLFAGREEVDEYLRLAALADACYQAREEDDRAALLALVPAVCEPGNSELLCERGDRLRNRCGRQLERWQEWDLALQVYASSASAPARERRVRVLQRQERFEDALQLCQEMECKPLCEEERDFISRQVPLLRRKLGLQQDPVPTLKFPQRQLVLPRHAERVEMAAVNFYEGEWQRAYYVENLLINGLFGLALWEEIFQPLPGAFVNPFQSAPLDMYSPFFYQRRRREIDARLQALESGNGAALLLHNHERFRGIANSWINWRVLDEQLVQEALAHIPMQHLLAMWRRVLFDPRANRSGFPDLVTFDEAKGYCMIEVKGPGDQLQANQKRWLRFFQQQEIPFQVARVSWLDD